MFYAWIPLFSYMGTTLGQMPAAAAIAATVAAAARDSSRRPGYGRYQDCSLHNEEVFFMFLILSRNFILFDLNNHRGCMSNRLVLKTFEKHS